MCRKICGSAGLCLARGVAVGATLPYVSSSPPPPQVTCKKGVPAHDLVMVLNGVSMGHRSEHFQSPGFCF
jgi:hypothetical protein